MTFSRSIIAHTATAAALLHLALHLLCREAKASSGSVHMIQKNIVGNAFYEEFDWQTFDDPTHGVVNYVDKETSIASQLSSTTATTFIMRADDTKVVDPTARGRDSVRISSKSTYEDGLFVLDLDHMPTGCSTWPAWWTVGANWPSAGEIDIIEGVNSQGSNLVSLHTSSDCSMPASRLMSGSATNRNCDVAANYNEGCGVNVQKANSFGPSFNSAGGGWYAMERSSHTGVKVWFWSRQDSSVPAAIAGGLAFVDASEFGTPDAAFTCDTCDWSSHFGPHNIVFDLTFCGDWAGTTYGSSGCSGSCSDHVRNNPADFAEAFWSINALRIYS